MSESIYIKKYNKNITITYMKDIPYDIIIYILYYLDKFVKNIKIKKTKTRKCWCNFKSEKAVLIDN
jgi:hypothetical protein